MQSRVFNGLKRWKSRQGTKGGRGKTAPSEFMRVPLDAISDLDDLITGFRERYGEHPDSPRNVRLFELLNRLDELFPPGETP